MKKTLSIILVAIILIIGAGCGKSQEGDVQQADVQQVDVQQTEKISVDDKLIDFEAIRDYLLQDEIFLSSYKEAQGEDFAWNNYEINHLDFNGDGKTDDAFIIYDDEDDYNPVIFVTLKDGEYQSYPSNIRAAVGSKIYMEDGFIVVEKDGYYRLATVLDSDEFGFIKDSYCGFSLESSEYNYLEGLDFKNKTVASIKKNDGYKDFEIDIKGFIYDEKGEEHLTFHTLYKNKFNEETFEHEQDSEEFVNLGSNEVLINGLAIGDNSSLKTFGEMVSESGKLENAIDYYVENRKDFDKKSRLKYINDFEEYSSYYSYYLYPEEESLLNSGGIKVKFSGEDLIKEEAKNIYKIVKSFYVEDGEGFDYRFALEDGEYFVTCVNPEYSKKIRVMRFDRALLMGEDASYTSREDDYVDAVFAERDSTYEEIEDIVYPTILLKNMDQLQELKGSKLWKTYVVIVPEEIEFLDYELPNLMEGFENEKLFSRDEEFAVNYQDYRLVIIPQQKSVNEEKLSVKTIDIGNEDELKFQCSFIVIGRLESGRITLRRNPLDENDLPETIEIGSLENVEVTVNAPMPTDFSLITVGGDWYYDMGDFEHIEFGISSVMDDTSYEIITRE